MTDAGEAVAARARTILAEVDGVRDQVDELRGLVRGRVSVGATLPAGELDVPRLLVRFSETFPGIEIDAADPPAEFQFERLSEEEVVAAFPAGGGPDRKRVTAAELARYALVTPRSGSAIKQALDDFFARAGRPLRIALESGDPFLLRCLVSTGFGAAVLPASLTLREGPAVDVRGLQPAVRLPATILWRRRRHQSPPARAFIDFVLAEVAQGTVRLSP